MRKALRGTGKYPARAVCMLAALWGLFVFMYTKLESLPSPQHGVHSMFEHNGEDDEQEGGGGSGGGAAQKVTAVPARDEQQQPHQRAPREPTAHPAGAHDLSALLIRGHAAGGRQQRSAGTTDAPAESPQAVDPHNDGGAADVKAADGVLEVRKTFSPLHKLRVLHYGHGIFHVQSEVADTACKHEEYVVAATAQPMRVVRESSTQIIVHADAPPSFTDGGDAAPAGASRTVELRVTYDDTTAAKPVTVTIDRVSLVLGTFGAPKAVLRGVRAATGLPERSTGLVLDDGKYELWNSDVQYKLHNKEPLYGAVPIVMGVGASADTSSGVLFVNPARTFVDVATDAEKETVTTAWDAKGGCSQFVVYPGGSAMDVLRQHAHTTGKPFFPPLFSMGYHQCRWTYKSQDDVKQVSAKFVEHDMPCDAVWLDIGHANQKHYFTWDPHTFSDPAGMLDAVKADGRKMITITDPHIARDRNYYVHNEATEKGYYVQRGGKPFEGWCWPGQSSWIDFLNPEARAWYAGLFDFDKYKGSNEDLYTWLDMNEPSVFSGPRTTMDDDAVHYDGSRHVDVHNLYGMLHSSAAFAGHLQRTKINSRPFILTRSFFAGSQRYAAVWTGDNKARWGYLEASVPMLLSLSVSGIPFVGADVGGFFEDTSPELMARWFQLGALYPFFRGHAHEDTKRKEPYLYSDEYHTAIHAAIHLRYALMPYVYTTFWNATAEGVPIWRPLFLEYPKEDPSRTSAFMVGDALLSVPIVEANTHTMAVDFPGTEAITWYHYESHEGYKGGSADVRVPVTLATYLLYQKSGTVVATKEVKAGVRSTEDQRTVGYCLRIAVDTASAAAHGRIYLDDERSRNYLDGDYNFKVIALEHGAITVRCAHSGPQSTYQAMPSGDKPYTPPSAPITSLVILGWNAELPGYLNATRAGGAVVVKGLDLPVYGGWALDLSPTAEGVKWEEGAKAAKVAKEGGASEEA